MKHVTLFSGGTGSWDVAKIVQRNLPPGDEHVLLYTDTLYEDADLYRFLIEGAANVVGRRLNSSPRLEDFPDYRVSADVPIEEYAGNPEWRAFLSDLRESTALALPELVWLTEGRDPWETFRDERFLGNSSVDPCSKILKRKVLDRWRKEHCDPATSIFYVGIGEHEKHRYDDGKGHGIGPRMAAMGWDYRAPLLDLPEKVSASNPAIRLRLEGLELPRLYALGYMHNNCGGFCCKAGQAHYQNRFRVQPERYAYDAMMEQKIRAFLDANVSMLTDRRGGDGKKPLTLDALADRFRADPQTDLFYAPGESGCGCMLDGDDG